MGAVTKQAGVNPAAVYKQKSMMVKAAVAARTRREAKRTAIRAAFASNVVGVLRCPDKRGEMLPSLNTLREISRRAQHTIDISVYAFTNVTVSTAFLICLGFTMLSDSLIAF